MSGAGAFLVLLAIGQAIALSPLMNLAVVLAPELGARVSPVAVAKPAFTLREGETVMITAAHQDFVLVRNNDGQSGWLAADELVASADQS
jgi:hypothetical protein